MQSKNPEALQGKRQQTNTGDVVHLPQRGTKKGQFGQLTLEMMKAPENSSTKCKL